MSYGFNLGNKTENDPSLLSWPSVVGKMLDIPVINLSKPGCGNDSILRRSTEYLIANKDKTFNPFIIISWSYLNRREFWNGDMDQFENDYNYLGNKITLGEINIKYNVKRNLLYLTHFKNLVTTLGYTYINGFYFAEDFHEISIYSEVEKVLFDYIIDDNFWPEGLNILAKGIPKLPCRHETVLGHKVIAIKFLEILKHNLYKDKDVITYHRSL